MRDILVATEDLYRTCGQPIPVIEYPPLIVPDDPVKQPRAVWDAMMRTIYLTSKDATAIATRSVGILRVFSMTKCTYMFYGQWDRMLIDKSAQSFQECSGTE